MVKPSALSSLIEEGQLPIKQRKLLGEETAETLRELILLGKLPAGASIPERDLADALGISRTPMREAMRVLETEGLIEYSATRRPSVANPSLETLAHNQTVIGVLEALGGRLACQQATQKELDNIIQMNQRITEKTDDAAPLEFFKMDMNFHIAIVTASGNHPLIETHRHYIARLWRGRFISSSLKLGRQNTLKQHQHIVDMLVKRDAVATAAALEYHLETSFKNVAKALIEQEKETSSQ